MVSTWTSRTRPGSGPRASRAASSGFDGKTLIHPTQVEPCNEIFAPDADEVAQAHKIIKAFAAAEKQGKAVVVVDGKMVENLHVENAKHVVMLADAIAKMH